jgi:hypothetical protein
MVQGILAQGEFVVTDKTAAYRKCTQCVHGNSDKPRVCGPCLMFEKNNFKLRKKGEWPMIGGKYVKNEG